MNTKQLFFLFIMASVTLKSQLEKNLPPPLSRAVIPLSPLKAGGDAIEELKHRKRRKRFGLPLPDADLNKRRRLDFTDTNSSKVISQSLEEYENKREMKQNSIDAFVEMASRGRLDAIKELLEPELFKNRRDREDEYYRRTWIITKRDRFCHTALHAAAIAGHKDIVAYLLQKNERDIINKLSESPHEKGMTPLMYAALFGRHTVVEELLKSSYIDPNYQDELGRTALHLAASQRAQLKNALLPTDSHKVQGYDTIIKHLSNDRSIDPDLRDQQNRTYSDILNSSC